MSYARNTDGKCVFRCDHRGCDRQYVGNEDAGNSFAMMRAYGWTAVCYDEFNFRDYCPEHKDESLEAKVAE